MTKKGGEGSCGLFSVRVSQACLARPSTDFMISLLLMRGSLLIILLNNVFCGSEKKLSEVQGKITLRMYRMCDIVHFNRENGTCSLLGFEKWGFLAMTGGSKEIYN